ncbi:unnamed protein product [Lupinus luteus]|uniref:Uncharacterized protein n=1 Tax=Lupinus luteus TaxID=3873 RepID=A0AAV1Y9E1_LUPLU
MLPKLEKLVVNSCRGCQILINEGEENVNFIESSQVKDLHLIECNLSDEFLPVYLTYFPNIETLYLNNNNFTILPPCIENCVNLKRLYLDDCKKLQQIMALPPNIKGLSAENCISLTSHATSLLLSQEIHEAGNTYFIFPGTKVPYWFDHRSKGSSVSFWFHNKLPTIAMCFVCRLLDKDSRHLSYELNVFINGKSTLCSYNINSFKFLSGHIYLFDLRLVEEEDEEFHSNQLDQAFFEGK